MHFITNSHKRFSKTNSTDLRQRVPLNLKKNKSRRKTNIVVLSTSKLGNLCYIVSLRLHVDVNERSLQFTQTNDVPHRKPEY